MDSGGPKESLLGKGVGPPKGWGNFRIFEAVKYEIGKYEIGITQVCPAKMDLHVSFSI